MKKTINLSQSFMNNEDCSSRLLKTWKNTPFFVKTINIIVIILYILSLFSKNIPYYLANIPYFTLLKFQLWRLFTGTLLTTNIINIFLSLILWVKEASKLESALGTIKYALIFCLNSTLIRIIYSIIIILVQFIVKSKIIKTGKIKGKITSAGLWPVIMCEICLLCLSNPNSKMKFLCIPYEFKAKFYPLVIFILCALFNSISNDIEILIGISYSFLYHYLLKNKLKISDNVVNNIERFCCCKKIGGFVSIQSLGSKVIISSREIINKINIGKGFTPFKGEGINVGETHGTKSDEYSGSVQNSITQSVRLGNIESNN